MSDKNKRLQAYRFDDVLVDVRDFRVVKNGLPRRITPRAFEVLIFLVSNGARVVGKQELFDAIWKESFVTDNALTRMVKEIRHVIGDEADSPRYIETVPKRGYRFIAEVERIETDGPIGVAKSGPIAASIAVLPFVNETGSEDNDYLSEGITDNVINHLSRLPNLRVAPRSAVFRFPDLDGNAIETGRQLNAEIVLSGRVSQKNETLIVNAELLDVAKESQIWGERYNYAIADIFDLQKQISRKICDQLQVKFSGDNGANGRPPDPEAYRLYLKGRYFWNRRPQGLTRGIEYFEQALEKDPNFALAHVGLADSYSTLGSWENGTMLPHVAMPKACAAAEKALKIDGHLAEAHTTLAYAKLHYDWDVKAAEAGFKCAVDLNPNYVHAWHWLSHFYMATGQIARSLEASLRALELDPLDLIINVHLAWHYWLAREPDQALRQAEKTRELDPHVIWSAFFAGLALEEKGMPEQAVAEFQTAVNMSPDFPLVQAALAHALGKSGQLSEAREIVEMLETRRAKRIVPAYDIAIARLGLNQNEAAITWLERAVEEHSGWAAYLAVEPRLDPLRPTEPFGRLIEQTGLRKNA